jgi:flagellar basal body-associated protein FliL
MTRWSLNRSRIDAVADEDTEDNAAPAKASGGMMKSLVSAASMFVAVLAALIVAQPVNRMIYGDPNAPDEVAEAEDPEAMAVVAAVDPASLDPAVYVPLDPALVVSLTSPDGASHFLQINVQAMTRDPDSADAIRDHAPALRNTFLFVISKHSFNDIATSEGKEELRQSMLTEAREVMRRNTGVAGIEELYFTSFVVQ